ncbi:MAG: hypothetical protein ABIF71_13215 [Planctomycetota bacterium]
MADLQVKLAKYITGVTEPFTLDDVFAHVKLKRTPRIERDVRDELDALFVKEGDRYVPGVCFLHDIPLRIKPGPWEIERGILIPGHRTVPHLPFYLSVDQVQLFDGGRLIATRRENHAFKEVEIYFTLLDVTAVPLEPGDAQGQMVRLRVWEMDASYRAWDFKEGDTLVLTPRDLREGAFDIRHENAAAMRAQAFAREQNDRLLMEQVLAVVDGPARRLSVDRLLRNALYRYSRLARVDRTVACSPLGPLVTASGGPLTITRVPGGAVVLHRKGADPVPKLPFGELEADGGDVIDDLFDPEGLRSARTIGDLLPYLGTAAPECLVHAIILDQLARDVCDGDELAEAIFFDPGIVPPSVMDRTMELLNRARAKFLKRKNCLHLTLPVRTARRLAIDHYLRIVNDCLRELNRRECGLEAVNQPAMECIVAIENNLEMVLEALEQTRSVDAIPGIHKALNMVTQALDRLIPETLAGTRPAPAGPRERGDDDEDDMVHTDADADEMLEQIMAFQDAQGINRETIKMHAELLGGLIAFPVKGGWADPADRGLFGAVGNTGELTGLAPVPRGASALKTGIVGIVRSGKAVDKLPLADFRPAGKDRNAGLILQYGAWFRKRAAPK